ncbi:hypothetical protein AB0M28_18760 [Streptomyces sp. NPDC051940]|uniref:hypothetical protein n=1 Tax=Streptomyces sp. NPDC051940 TaxID=3155675 RepID=UPI0034264B1F
MNRPGGFDVEAELSAALAEFARTEPVPAYRPQEMVRAARRRTRRSAAAFTVAAVGVAVAVLAVLLPGAGAREEPRPLPAVDSTPTPVAREPLDGSEAVRALLEAAVRYRIARLRPLVRPAEVAGLFADRAAYTRVWGADGLGVTCGGPADGFVLGSHEAVTMYDGTRRRVDAAFVLTDDGRVAGVRCSPSTDTAGDDALGPYFGGLTVIGDAGGRAEDEVDVEAARALEAQYATAAVLRGPDFAGLCGGILPHVWIAETPAGAGWTVWVNGGPPAQVAFDEHGLITSVRCGS